MNSARLPHVPREFSATIEASDIDPAVLGARGRPRPRYRGIPIPSTSRIEPGLLNIIQSDETLWKRCFTELLCVLCSEPLATEPDVYFFASPADTLLARGGLHRHCAKVTAHWCVWVRDRLLDDRIGCFSAPTAAFLTGDGVTVATWDDDETLAEQNVIAEFAVELRITRPHEPLRRDRLIRP